MIECAGMRFPRPQKTWLVPAALLLATLAMYGSKLPTAFSFEDSAEFVTASAVLGIAHPSGYPLPVLLGRLFAALPFGTLPWRVALLSAVCAAAAIAVLFVAVREVLEARGEKLRAFEEAAVALAVGVFAVSPLWWSQAVYAKMYTLHALLLALTTLTLVRWRVRPTRRGLGWIGLWFGLACANHLFLTLLAVPFVLMALLPAVRPWRGRRSGLLSAGAFAGAAAVGMLLYLYVLFRMPSAPFATVTFSGVSGWLKFMARSNYADVGASTFSDRVGFIVDYLRLYAAELGVLFPLAAVGAAALWRGRHRDRGLFAWLLGVAVAPFIVTLARSAAYSTEAAYLYRVYAVGSLAVLALLAGIGFVWLLRRAWTRWQRAALLIALVLFATVHAVRAQPLIAVTASPFVEEWVRATLTGLPQNAAFVVLEEGVVSDTLLFGLAELQVAEGLRPDVTVVTDVPMRPFHKPEGTHFPADASTELKRRGMLRAAQRDPSLQGRPIVTSFPPASAGWDEPAFANGTAFQLAPNDALPPATSSNIPPEVTTSFAAQRIAAHILYLEAARSLQEFGLASSSDAFFRAMSLDAEPLSSDYRGFVAHRAAMSAWVEPSDKAR